MLFRLDLKWVVATDHDIVVEAQQSLHLFEGLFCNHIVLQVNHLDVTQNGELLAVARGSRWVFYVLCVFEHGHLLA